MTLNKRQKIVLAISLPVLLLLGAVFYLGHRLDAGKIMQIAAGQVKSATGRDLQVRGPISVTVFPRISITAEQVTLSNPMWATDPEMLSAGRVAFSLRWAPLFHQRIEIDDVSVERAVLSLQAAPAGHGTAGSWVLNAAPDAAIASDDSFVFDLNRMHLSQVQVNYRDQTQAISQSLTINQLDIRESGRQSLLEGALVLNALPIGVKGKTTSLTRLMAAGDASLELLDVDLNLTLAGQPALMQGTLNVASAHSPTVSLKIQSQAMDLRQLIPAMSAVQARGAHGVSSGSNAQRLFSDTPIGMDQWPTWQGHVSLDIGSLTLPDGLTLKQLSTTVVADTDSQLVSQDSLTITPLSFQLGEGRVTASGTVSGVHGAQPAIQVRGYATGFTLGHLMAQLGESRQLSGGPTVVAFHLNSRGVTPHGIAANLSGEAQVSVGPAVVSSALFNNSGDFLVSVLNAINPLRKSTDQNNVQCMVAYLPIQNGLVRINQSVGMRSDRLDVTLDGRLNLGAETLALKIYPQQRSGLTTGVNPAGLVQINGTLMNPSMGINKTGVVKQAAGVGLAIVTGGVSLIAQNAASVVTRSNPCDNVLRPWSQVAGGLAINH